MGSDAEVSDGALSGCRVLVLMHPLFVSHLACRRKTCRGFALVSGTLHCKCAMPLLPSRPSAALNSVLSLVRAVAAVWMFELT